MRSLKLIIVMFLVAGLALPLLQQITHRIPEGRLSGYIPPLTSPPADLVAAWFDRRLQHWLEEHFAADLGFRTALVRTYNEASFRLFHGLPHLSVTSLGKPDGLLYQAHTMALNDSVLHRAERERDYGRAARHALVLQHLLERQGTYLLMVIAPSRGGSYPDLVPRKFLSENADVLLEQGVHYGDVLERSGVQTIDFGREFRRLRPQLSYRLDSPYGVHWNFQAGCLAAQAIVARLGHLSGDPLVDINCDQISMETAHWTDTDGLTMLNLWHPEDYQVQLPYPIPHDIATKNTVRPRLLIVGDSFSDQIRRTISLSRAFSETSFSSYFKMIGQDGSNGVLLDGGQRPLNPGEINLNTLKNFRFVVVECADYNAWYYGYGFFENMLGQILPVAQPGMVFDFRDRGQTMPMLILGWGQSSNLGVKVTNRAAMLSFQYPAVAGPHRLRLEVAGGASSNEPPPVVWVNGRILPVTVAPGRIDGAGPDASTAPSLAELQIDIPDDLLAGDSILTVTLEPKSGGSGLLLRRLILG